ncbi:MAG: glycosyltransferase [Phascolarctobacterium sp.]|nr:glycosyltransferase [Phascolarctobacterium sp.]
MISVIIPVYKAEKYLQRCVDSVLNQTYQDLEIILVDDGSPDKCPKICDEYAQKDKRVKVIHQQNQGQACARNVAMQVAAGEYLTFLDSDDWLDLDTYEHVINRVKVTGADVMMFNFVEEYGNKQRECRIDLTKYSNTGKIKQGFLTDKVGSYCRNVYHRELWKDIQFPLNCYYEDLAIIIDVVMRAKHIEIIDKCFYHYDFTNNQSTTTSWSAKSKYGMFLGAFKRINYAEQIGDKDVVEHFRKRAFKTCVTGLSMDLVTDALWSEQKQIMQDFLLNNNYGKMTKGIGRKYRLLRWGLLHCEVIPKIYGRAMFGLLKLKKAIK